MKNYLKLELATFMLRPLTMQLIVLLALLAPSGVLAQTARPALRPDNKEQKLQHVTTHGRPASLSELYSMFFHYAVHIDASANEDEARGLDSSFFRDHLRRASGLTVGEYEVVLASARNVVTADEELSEGMNAQLAPATKPRGLGSRIPNMLSDAPPAGISLLLKKRKAALRQAIEAVKAELGDEQSHLFEMYLKTSYRHRNLGAAPSAKPSTVKLEGTGRSELSADDVTLDSGTECDNDDYACSDAQIAFRSTGYIDLWSYVSTGETWDDDYNNDEVGYWSDCDGVPCNLYGTWIEPLYDGGELSINGSGAYYCGAGTVPCPGPGWSTATTNVEYTWTAIGNLFWSPTDPDEQCTYPSDGNYGPCTDNTQETPSDLYIPAPDINSLSTTSFTLGLPGNLTADGEGLISPFQNPPTCSSPSFTTCTVSSFDPDAGTVAIAYSVSGTASPGSSSLSIDNGFGSDSYEITISEPAPVISGISVSGSTASNQLDAGPDIQTVTLTGENFGSTAPAITVATGSEYVTIVSGSIGVPSVSPASKHRMLSTSPRKDSVIAKSGTQTVTFNVQVADDAPAGSADFQLSVADASGSPATSPDLTVDPIQPTPVLILDGTADDNNDTCSGDNIGQGAASAQQVVVGQIIAFTACTNNSDLSGWGGSTTVTAGWAAPSNFTTDSAIGNYVLGNLVKNTANSLGNPQVYSTASITPVTISPNCPDSITFCDFTAFYFVLPGTYDFTFTYNLNNGTEAQSATVEYIVLAPTLNGQCNGQPCAFTTNNPYATIQIYPPGTLNNNTVPILSSGNRTLLHGSALDVSQQATAPSTVVGSFYWVQLILSRDIALETYPSADSCPTCLSLGGIDNTYPYPVSPVNPSEALDNPWTNLSATLPLYELNDTFEAQMFLMWDPALNPNGTSGQCAAASTQYVSSEGTYGPAVKSTPSNCTGSVPVPLGSMLWGYCATAINTQQAEPNTWILSCPANGTPDVPQVYVPSAGSTSYPVWSALYSNSL